MNRKEKKIDREEFLSIVPYILPQLDFKSIKTDPYFPATNPPLRIFVLTRIIATKMNKKDM